MILLEMMAERGKEKKRIPPVRQKSKEGKETQVFPHLFKKYPNGDKGKPHVEKAKTD